MKQKQADQRYAIERGQQLTVLITLAAVILLISVVMAGVHNVFPPGWWHIDLPRGASCPASSTRLQVMYG